MSLVFFITVGEPPAKQRIESTVDEDDSNERKVNKIRVYIRVRPENEREHTSRRVVEVIDDRLLIFDPREDDGYTYRGVKYKEIGKKANKDLTFTFASVFDDKSSNLKVYERAIKNFIPSLLDGFNCTVFAYGATGSGKTYTMLGSGGDPGVIYFAVMELFHNLEMRPSNEKYEVYISYFEIYNEKVMDLIGYDSKPLKVFDDEKGGVTIADLTVKTVKDADQLIAELEVGNLKRAQQATDANAMSSRSHAVFQLNIRKQKCSNGKQIIKQESKMCLVDLAGSERASVAYKENRSKSLQREGGNINKSLLALGNCINALANQTKNRYHKNSKTYIPYRSSVLTRILADSLGGNCKTAMIATVSPSSFSYDDTHNTLTYANRTQGINLYVKRKSYTINVQPRYHSLAIEALQHQNTELAEKVILLQAELAKLQRMPLNPISSQMSSIDILNSYKNSIDKLLNERLDLRKRLLESESNLKKIEVKCLIYSIQVKPQLHIFNSCFVAVFTFTAQISASKNGYGKVKNITRREWRDKK